MMKAVTFTVRVAVMTGIMLAASTQSARAYSGDTHKDRGKSCIAHALHKPTTHPHGFRHECRQKDVPVTITTVPITDSSESPAAVIDMPSDTPVVSENATSETSPSPASSVSLTPRVGEEIVVIEAPVATTSVPETKKSFGVTPGNGDGDVAPSTTVPQVVTGGVDSPSSVNDSDSRVDGVLLPANDQFDDMAESADEPIQDGALFPTEAMMNESMKLATAQARQQATMQFWWLLLLLLIAAESYRRGRRARRNCGTASDVTASA